MKVNRLSKSRITLSTCLVMLIAAGQAGRVRCETDATDDRQVAECLQNLIVDAPDEMTVGEMRATCRQPTVESELLAGDDEQTANAVDERLRVDEENILKPFTIMAHRPNYFLLGANNFSGYSPEEYRLATGDPGLRIDQTEAQFQLSIKTPLAVDILASDVDLFAAYTVKSYWQVYNKGLSSPFRETNHEPEIWLQAHPRLELFGFTNEIAALGLVHQSNGKSGNLSRSWNRIFANFVFNRGDFAFSLKPWVRISEDTETDDNPDITDFLGHFELQLAYRLGEHTFSMMSRNNLESGFSKGAVELGWSFPLFDYPFLKGYLQYFSGYGESLIDYDRYVNRLGAGILLTDFL